MSEVYQDNRYDEEAAKWQLKSVKAEIASQAELPPNHDPRLQAFAFAAHYLIQNGQLEDALENAIYYRMATGKNVYASNMVLMLQQCIQFELIEPDSTDYYPGQFTEPSLWANYLESIPRDSHIFWDNMVFRDPKNNISQRYKPAQILARMLSYKLGREPNILDIGTSEMLGPKLLYSSQFNFKPIKVFENKEELQEDSPLSEKVNSILSDKLKGGECIGIDKKNEILRSGTRRLRKTQIEIGDAHHNLWTFSNSFYPSELLDEDKVEEFFGLKSESPRNVKFFESDAITVDTDKLRNDTGIEKFDLIVLSHMLYQLDPENQKIVLDKVHELVQPEWGKVMIEEFAHSDNNNLVFEQFWPPWHERTIVEDMQEPGVFKNTFLFSDRRCSQMEIIDPEMKKLILTL